MIRAGWVGSIDTTGKSQRILRKVVIGSGKVERIEARSIWIFVSD